MSDIGHMTFGLRANTKDIADVWMETPWRRSEFGQREITDMRETYLALTVLLREIDRQSTLKVVRNG